MTPPPIAVSKTFSVGSATLMLPLVQAIMADVVRLSTEIDQTRERLDNLVEGRAPTQADDFYGGELEAIEKVTNRKTKTVRACCRELVELGLLASQPENGFVDFPAERSGERVCLCWQLGEPEVKYWHAIDESCSQRKLVDAELVLNSGQLKLTHSTFQNLN